MKTIGIVAHSAEGGALCFVSACREGQRQLGEHMHPPIVVSAIPMGLSMDGWESGDHAVVARRLTEGVEQVARAGADFFVCPDNTAHMVLEGIVGDLPIPGLHIADVVCDEIARKGWRRAGLLGTTWTMTGTVYESALGRRGIERLVPDEATMTGLNSAIFAELCQGVFRSETRDRFVEAIATLKERGAECVILGCTEIPLIVSSEDSPLPVLDSTRLLASAAVLSALDDQACPGPGWIPLPQDEWWR